MSGTHTGPNAEATVILGRDKHTCQVCGQRGVFTTSRITTPDDAPCAAAVEITACPTCARLFQAPFEDTPALAHLIETRRTSNYGMPYLFAQLRAVTTPLAPVLGLSEDATTLLAMLRSTPNRIKLRTARNRLADLTKMEFRRVLDELEWHGYAYDGLDGSALLRMDFYARPPLLANLTPIPDEPSLVRALAEGRPIEHDPAAYLLANLYQHAGSVMSKRALKKRLLLAYLSHDVYDARLLFIHRALVGLEVLREHHEAGKPTTFRLSRRLRDYTSLRNYAMLHQLLTVPNSNEWDLSLRTMIQSGMLPKERRAAAEAPTAAMRALRHRKLRQDARANAA